VLDPLPGTKPELVRLAGLVTPDLRPGDYAQAVMDLGATVCTPRNPACGICPLLGMCEAQRLGIAAELPRSLPENVVLQDVIEGIRQSVAAGFGVNPETILLLRAASIPAFGRVAPRSPGSPPIDSRPIDREGFHNDKRKADKGLRRDGSWLRADRCGRCTGLLVALTPANADRAAEGWRGGAVHHGRHRSERDSSHAGGATPLQRDGPFKQQPSVVERWLAGGTDRPPQRGLRASHLR